MSDIVNAFSPSLIYILFDGRQISFKRMLSRQWAALVAQIRAERMEEQNIEINKQVGEKDHDQRARARLIAQQTIREGTTIQQVIDYSTRDAEGVDRLLKFAALQVGLSETEWEGSDDVAGVVDMIPTTQKLQIAEEIAFLPIIPPQNPPSPGGEKASDTAGPTPLPNPTGIESPELSNTSSGDTPEASPSAS